MRPDKELALKRGIPPFLRRHAARYHVGVDVILQTHAKYPTPLLDHWRERSRVHSDHPLRHWDRTCPACTGEAGAPA